MFRVDSGLGGGILMPVAGNEHAHEVDGVFTFINTVCIFFFILIIALSTYFVIKYRQTDPGQKPEKSPSHNTTIEIVWTVIPIVIVVIMFVYGFTNFMNAVVPPENSYQIKVTGRKWSWTFEYPNGYIDPNLHVPAGEDIKLLITSEDVVHSVYIPAFRIKRDAIPGRYTVLTFNAADAHHEGEGYHLFCAEYCGTDHSAMRAQVYIQEREEFDAWLLEASDYVNNLGPLLAGEKLYLERGCKSCHSLDGKAGTGPSLMDLYGNPHPLADGSEVVPDENFIRESLLFPKAKIYAGYQPVMPTFKGSLSDPEIDALITYIKAQSSKSKAEADQAQAEFEANKPKEEAQ
jgi:cytochrome c oxidase subunit 2